MTGRHPEILPPDFDDDGGFEDAALAVAFFLFALAATLAMTGFSPLE